MALKNLYAFEQFDLPAFLTGKALTVTTCRPWLDFDTKKELGTVVEVAITKDTTDYPPSKGGGVATNLYEKFSIKVPKTIVVPVGAIVAVENGTATVYGDYRNQLSVRADDVKVIQPPAAPASAPASK